MSSNNASRIVDELLCGKEARVVLEVPLKPVTGTRFQPTGFPDLGAALYPDPSGRGERLLVESAQSMANRLEAVCWDEAAGDVVTELKAMPYVKVDGDVKTSSILEAHRLNSPYILQDADFQAAFEERAELGKGTVSRPAYAAAVLHYDPNSLVHGSFMSQVGAGTARLERMLSAFIEAEGVQVAESGGVKIDRNDTSGKDAGGSEKGFGNVPYHCTEFVAARIFASFSLDLAGIRGLRLPEPGARVVTLLALFKVRTFLDSPKRLRTACDLEIADANADEWTVRPAGFVLPELGALTGAIREALGEAEKAGLFPSPPITSVTYRAKGKR